MVDFEQIISELAREFDGERQAEEREEVAELAEAELVSATISDRLRGAEGRRIKAYSAFNVSASGLVVRVNPAWVLLQQEDGQELVSAAAIALVEGLYKVAPEPSLVEKRLGLAHILRKIMRERRRVAVRAGAHLLSGFIGAVYADHVDIVHEAGVTSVALPHLFSVKLLRGY